jgi:hypothetical protein
MRVSQDGHAASVAYRTGQHDDPVTALGPAPRATPERVYVD